MRVREGKNPGLFWLGGFKSDMKGTKAEALDRWARREGRACVRFDYSGHGESGGAFTDGTIGRWLEESLAVYLHFAQGPQVRDRFIHGRLAGVAVCARACPSGSGAAPIAGMVLIAPAVDFTEELMWKQFPDVTKREIEQKGLWMRPSAYGEEPYPITRDADRGWPQASVARRTDRNTLPGAHPARRAGSGRAVEARRRTCVALFPR